jgi:hypothetical protein
MNNDQLTDKVIDLDHRLTVVEEQAKNFATNNDLNINISRIERAQHETAIELKNLATNLSSFSEKYSEWLKERAVDEKAEREEKLQMQRQESEAKIAAIQRENDAKIAAIQQKTWPEAIARWGKVIGLVLGLMTLVTGLYGFIIWIAKTAK